LTESKDTNFESWIRSRYNPSPFYIRGHRFEKSQSGSIIIDRGTFELEEAIEIGHMLLSINPIAKMSAQIAIWEKNGFLVKGVLVVAILLLILIVLILRR
jgi:uncharacterized membrane protein